MTNFAKKVYDVTSKIPKGKVVTYSQIALKIGNPKSARAVGNALHKNPDSFKYPCHRVVNVNGRLATNFGFGGSREQKLRLLSEGVDFIDETRVDLKNSLWV
ncbi:MAG TPA: MGMT family protein [Patescibacteria group bacterium]